MDPSYDEPKPAAPWALTGDRRADRSVLRIAAAFVTSFPVVPLGVYVLSYGSFFLQLVGFLVLLPIELVTFARLAWCDPLSFGYLVKCIPGPLQRRSWSSFACLAVTVAIVTHTGRRRRPGFFGSSRMSLTSNERRGGHGPPLRLELLVPRLA